jgi:hypothetical protein
MKNVFRKQKIELSTVLFAFEYAIIYMISDHSLILVNIFIKFILIVLTLILLNKSKTYNIFIFISTIIFIKLHINL